MKQSTSLLRVPEPHVTEHAPHAPNPQPTVAGGAVWHTDCHDASPLHVCARAGSRAAMAEQEARGTVAPVESEMQLTGRWDIPVPQLDEQAPHLYSQIMS